MKSTVYTLLAFAFLFAAQSCKKDDPLDPKNPNSALCVRYNWGTLGIDNYERDYYKVILNGKLEGTITPFGYLKLVLPPGEYTLRFVETGQFVKVPKTKNSTATVLQCVTTDLPLTL